MDDSSTYLNELSAVLREEGYEVVAARSGVEALDWLAAQQVDCILLDLFMPGLDASKLAAASRPRRCFATFR